ncbi:hypothetical protein ACLKA6_003913 [Drosophila palustris]
MDYKKKYAKLKSRVKNYVLENASIIDEVCYLQAELSAARAERLTLIEKLMSYEGLEKGSITQMPLLNESRDLPNKHVGEKQHAVKKSNKILVKLYLRIPISIRLNGYIQ